MFKTQYKNSDFRRMLGGRRLRSRPTHNPEKLHNTKNSQLSPQLFESEGNRILFVFGGVLNMDEDLLDMDYGGLVGCPKKSKSPNFGMAFTTVVFIG